MDRDGDGGLSVVPFFVFSHIIDLIHGDERTCYLSLLHVCHRVREAMLRYLQKVTYRWTSYSPSFLCLANLCPKSIFVFSFDFEEEGYYITIAERALTRGIHSNIFFKISHRYCNDEKLPASILPFVIEVDAGGHMLESADPSVLTRLESANMDLYDWHRVYNDYFTRRDENNNNNNNDNITEENLFSTLYPYLTTLRMEEVYVNYFLSVLESLLSNNNIQNLHLGIWEDDEDELDGLIQLVCGSLNGLKIFSLQSLSYAHRRISLYEESLELIGNLSQLTSLSLTNILMDDQAMRALARSLYALRETLLSLTLVQVVGRLPPFISFLHEYHDANESTSHNIYNKCSTDQLRHPFILQELHIHPRSGSMYKLSFDCVQSIVDMFPRVVSLEFHFIPMDCCFDPMLNTLPCLSSLYLFYGRGFDYDSNHVDLVSSGIERVLPTLRCLQLLRIEKNFHSSPDEPVLPGIAVTSSSIKCLEVDKSRPVVYSECPLLRRVFVWHTPLDHIVQQLNQVHTSGIAVPILRQFVIQYPNDDDIPSREQVALAYKKISQHFSGCLSITVGHSSTNGLIFQLYDTGPEEKKYFEDDVCLPPLTPYPAARVAPVWFAEHEYDDEPAYVPNYILTNFAGADWIMETRKSFPLAIHGNKLEIEMVKKQTQWVPPMLLQICLLRGD
eukprot:TRINITY_DN5762_c0_g1_i1.p1 TRINITY_DN5762_c0_g1~~TRINITY_DN5762_c0_g1_i1.p1  ORF type:complete len:673 (+),score=42.36 TRINITY_DN5762_c0_g1_i1:105-2123(+)